MAAPHVYSTEAVVLRQRRLAEADKVCVLFTPSHGRIEAVAKGVRRPKSRLAGHLEPLTRSRLLLARGRNLDIITQAETLDARAPLRQAIDRLSRGLYAAELVDRLTDRASDTAALYQLLVATLARLETAANLDLPLRWFEMHVLGDQGYRPQLERCVRCDAGLQPGGNAFAGRMGGVLCPRCRAAEPGRPLSSTAFKLLRFLQRTPYPDVAIVHVEAALGAEVERHLRDAVEAALDQEVRAARFIEVVRTAAALAGTDHSAPQGEGEQPCRSTNTSANPARASSKR